MPATDTTIALERGQYRLREQIGGSVYGVVWRAAPVSGGGDVAVKLVNREQMARALPLQRERWVASAGNEIAFLRALGPWDSRHIVRLVDSGWHDGLPVMALELMSSDLGRHLARRKAVGEWPHAAEALDWLAQLNQALAKVHQYGWRYLDLKPANVLVDVSGGTVKLADFGTNRQLAASEAHSYAGTASWQAPEQYFPTPDGTYATGRRTDYFALGALLFYLISGGTPLRWSTTCADAYRDHLADGARQLLRQGPMPAPLQPDEDTLFCRALPARARAPALRLLRQLLDPIPAARPGNALQISRMLADIRSALVETCA